MKTIEEMHNYYMGSAIEYRKNRDEFRSEQIMDIVYEIRGYARSQGIDWRSWDNVVHGEKNTAGTE